MSDLITIVNEAIPLREGHEKEDIYKRLALLQDIKRCVAKLQRKRLEKTAKDIAQRAIAIRSCAFKKQQDLIKREWLKTQVQQYLNEQLEGREMPPERVSIIEPTYFTFP